MAEFVIKAANGEIRIGSRSSDPVSIYVGDQEVARFTEDGLEAVDVAEPEEIPSPLPLITWLRFKSGNRTFVVQAYEIT